LRPPHPPAPAIPFLSAAAHADFLCPLSANVYGLEFVEFRIREVVPVTSIRHPHPQPARREVLGVALHL
jgi:hypothetical protein